MRAGKRYRGGVRIVVRLENDDLVTHLGKCQNGCRDRLGSAGGDEHLAIGVVVELVATSMVVAYRLTQLGDAQPGWVLVVAPRIAAIASARSSSGPSVSGKPWPRLMLPVATARADISAKIVVPKPRMRRTSGSFPGTWTSVGRDGAVGAMSAASARQSAKV